MIDAHNITLLESELQEIETIVLVSNGIEEPLIIKDGYIYKDVIDYLNEITGQSYRYAKAHKTIIEARIKEKYTLEDFKRVIDVKSGQWLNTTQAKYLRPSTLFQASKMDGYLQESKVKSKQSAGDNNFNFNPTDSPVFK